MADLDNNHTWNTVAYGAIAPGDLYVGVAFLDLDRDFHLALTGLDEAFAPVLFSFGLVLRTFLHYVVLAPVLTSLDVSDQRRFKALVEAGREARDYVRLPELAPFHWGGDAVALISRPQTLTDIFVEQLPSERVAAMTDGARSILIDRVHAAW